MNRKSWTLLVMAFVLGGCERFDFPTYTKQLDYELRAASTPARIVKRMPHRRSLKTRSHAAMAAPKRQEAEIRYTAQGRAILPNPPSPPVIEIHGGSQVLSAPLPRQADGRWLREFGRW